MTILTASTKEQDASEKNGSGVFTTLFVDALNGAATNLVGDVTPGSVYAHVDQSLGPVGPTASVQDQCQEIRVVAQGSSADRAFRSQETAGVLSKGRISACPQSIFRTRTDGPS